MLEILSCPICDGNCKPLDVVDFNKSCEEARGKFLRLSGISIYYYLCNQCGFCFAPEFRQWDLKDFEEKIYNEKYIEVDPDYKTVRPEANARDLITMFNGKEPDIKHLDYGGGNGRLSDILKGSGWRSSTYDPFINRGTDLNVLGRFNLITAFEVFEHVPDTNKLILQLKSLLKDEGIILFSTLLSDGNISPNQRIHWWYVSPRNGHISLFSKTSLNLLAQKHGLLVGSFNPGMHVLFRKIPEWSAHIIKAG